MKRSLPGCGALMLLALLLPAVSSTGASRAAGSATAGLAFNVGCCDTSVSVSAANGSGRHQLGPGDGTLLSPNGTMVASNDAFANSKSTLAIYEASGGTVPVPTALTHGQVIGVIAWSPDSKYLAVSIADTVGDSVLGNAAVDVIDVPTHTVTVHEPGFAWGGSFEPGSSDAFVYGLAQSRASDAPTNLYEVPADGSGSAHAVTTNGESEGPVWGAKGIVFDLFTHRKGLVTPTVQLALLHGTTITQITHTSPTSAVGDLVPAGQSAALSASGVDLAVNSSSVGGGACVVNLVTGKVTALTIRGEQTTAWGISRDGRSVLVSYHRPHQTGATIAKMPSSGGTPTVLVSGAEEPSWNQ